MPLVLDENPKNIVDRIFKMIKRMVRDFQRSQLRNRVVRTRPAPTVTFEKFQYRIHMLMCRRDLTMAICACKSLVLAAGEVQPFIFHDDGSLLDHDVDALLRQFPGAKVIGFQESLSKATQQFGKDSPLLCYRQKGVMMLKLLDIRLFAETEKVIIMDSDIIFFKKPETLFRMAKDLNAPNAFNRDIASAYMMERQVLEGMAGTTLLPELNAGLSVVHVNTIDFGQIEIWLKKLQGKRFIMHRIEQSLMAMLSAVSAHRTEYLPATYDVSYFKEVTECVCKHYVGRIRFGFELEGLHYLYNKMNFKSNWNSLIGKLHAEAKALFL